MHALAGLLAVAAGLSAAAGQPLSDVRRSGSRRAEDARLVRLNVRDVPLEARSGDALLDFLATESQHVASRYDVARVDALGRRSAEASWDVLNGRRAYGGELDERSPAFGFEEPFDIHAARLARRQAAPVTTSLVDLYASAGGVSTDAAYLTAASFGTPAQSFELSIDTGACCSSIIALTSQAPQTSGSSRRTPRRRSGQATIHPRRRPTPAPAGQSSSSTAAATRPGHSAARPSRSPARPSPTRASSSSRPRRPASSRRATQAFSARRSARSRSPRRRRSSRRCRRRTSWRGAFANYSTS